MNSVTVQLSNRQIEALKASTGKRSAAAALKAWAARANANRSIAELRAALKDSLKEEATGKGRRFGSGRRRFVGSRTDHCARFKRDYRLTCARVTSLSPATELKLDNVP